MERLQFDASSPNLTTVRQAVFQRLRDQKGWNQLLSNSSDHGFQPYLNLHPPRMDEVVVLQRCVLDVFWQLVTEGILAPGENAGDMNLPWFHLTVYGCHVIAEDDYQPHDPTGYIHRLTYRVGQPDSTVRAYLEESLNTFVRGSVVASMVMLGVAAERVFDLLCQSMATAAVMSPRERTRLEASMKRTSIKPRIDIVQEKFQQVQNTAGFPESATLMVTAMYDMIRAQRNDLGHPREQPPKVDRQEAHARLQMFGVYYETAERVRQFLSSH